MGRTNKSVGFTCHFDEYASRATKNTLSVFGVSSFVNVCLFFLPENILCSTNMFDNRSRCYLSLIDSFNLLCSFYNSSDTTTIGHEIYFPQQYRIGSSHTMTVERGRRRSRREPKRRRKQKKDEKAKKEEQVTFEMYIRIVGNRPYERMTGLLLIMVSRAMYTSLY